MITYATTLFTLEASPKGVRILYLHPYLIDDAQRILNKFAELYQYTSGPEDFAQTVEIILSAVLDVEVRKAENETYLISLRLPQFT